MNPKQRRRTRQWQTMMHLERKPPLHRILLLSFKPQTKASTTQPGAEDSWVTGRVPPLYRTSSRLRTSLRPSPLSASTCNELFLASKSPKSPTKHKSTTDWSQDCG